MANKRVTELAPISVIELAVDDLFLLADVSEFESKKLKIVDLRSYILNGGNITGSFNGTASYALQALSASWAPCCPSASYAATSSWSWNSLTASYILHAISASYALSASYSLTASYALSCSCETVNSAAFATYSQTASYLLYTGIPNGTASYAFTASYAISTSYQSVTNSDLADLADSASYLIYTPGINNGTASNARTASYALTAANARTASYALTAANLSYTGVPNGTASYALAVAGLNSGIPINWGIKNAITKSISSASIDLVNISSPTSIPETTDIQAWGNLIVPYTSSTIRNEYITLIALNRWSGITASIDSADVNVNIGGTSTTSGTLNIPFSLGGEALLSGSYVLYVSSSNNIYLNTTRSVRFGVVSPSNNITFGAGESLRLMTNYSYETLTFSSSLGGPAVNTAANIATSSSDMYSIDASSVTGIRYVWTLPNLVKFTCTSNPLMQDIGGMPNSIVTMSINDNSIMSLAPLTYTSASILICSSNVLTRLPDLARTMSYISCSFNPLTSLPAALPYGLTKFYCSNTNLTSVSTTFPNSIVSMSFDSSSLLSAWTSTLPTSLKLFTFNNSPNLNPASQANICSDLAGYGLTNGYLNITGSQPIVGSIYSSSIETNINTLKSNAWTVII